MKNYIGLFILAAGGVLLVVAMLIVNHFERRPAPRPSLAVVTNAAPALFHEPRHRHKLVWVMDAAKPTNSAAANFVASSNNEPANAAPVMTINGYVVQDPMARISLSYIGTDPDADIYWAQAINDPNLPAEERKDLIEDLNEDGLDNPEDPTPEDMDIIAYRLELIEDLAPNAMDQVNADAFEEAYKDLINLYNGIPPQ